LSCLLGKSSVYSGIWILFCPNVVWYGLNEKTVEPTAKTVLATKHKPVASAVHESSVLVVVLLVRWTRG
jgi:hypothetical protein